jgi:hypothetical protein
MEIPKGFKKALYRRIPVYYNEETTEMIGRNWFYDLLAEINAYIDFHILEIEEVPILIEVDEDEK